MPLRILHLIPSLGAGGAERSLAASLERHRAAGVMSSVLCFRRAVAGVHAAVESLGVPVGVIEATDPLHRARAIGEAARANEADLIHTSLFAPDILGRVAGRLAGVPVVTSLVNTAYDDARLEDPNVHRGALRVYRAVDGVTARRWTAGFRALSTAVRDSAVKDLRIDPGLVRVIPRGRDLRRYRPATPDERRAARAALGIHDDRLVVGNVARQEHQKGLETLILAVAALERHGRPVALVQAGRRGSASPGLDRLVLNAGVSHAVRFLGHVDDVPGTVLPALDVFAFPSRYEGFGGAVIEAMAAGLPVVASDLPALAEVTAGAAELVPVDDAAALARALARAADEDTSCRRARARAVAAARYDLDQVAAAELEWYESVVARRRG